jgi:hypothetical protein
VPLCSAGRAAAGHGETPHNNEMELTRSAMARQRGPRSSSQCSTDPRGGAMTASARLLCLAALGILVVPVHANARCRSVAIRVNGTLASPLGARELALQATPDPRGKSRTTISVDGKRFVAETAFYPGSGSDGAEEDCSGLPENISVSLVSGDRQREVARLSFPRDFRNVKGTWLIRSAIRVDPERDLAIQ